MRPIPLPRQNGKAERFNRIPASERASRKVFTRHDQRTTALAPWLEYYDARRRQTALGGLPPASRLSPNVKAGYIWIAAASS